MAHQAIGPGSVVASRFRLEDLLDEHSGARFWRATDLTLARNVAIHVLASDDPRGAALLTAARTSATVSEAHLLRVLDALEEGDLVHVVHEWGSGVSLDRMLAEDVLDPRRAAWLVREVAEAITVAHRHGIAHGRLLPENVMVTDAGTVKLIGFVVDAVLHGRPQRPTDTLPAPSEHEADVLNLGALLYACLTGKWPGFPESVLPDAPFDHEQVYRPRRVRAGIPKQLDTLCDEILNGDPRDPDHVHTAAAVAAALGEFLGEGVGPAFAVTDPTAFLDLDAVPTRRAPGTLGSFDGIPDPEATQAGVPPWAETDALSDERSDERADDTADHGDLEATQAAPLVARATPREPDDDDVEATRRAPALPPSAVPAAAATSTTTQPPVDGPHRVPGTGMGGGVVPPYWGPDSPEDSGSWAAQEPARSDPPGSTWLRLGVLVGVVVLVVLAAIVALTLAGRDVVPGINGGGNDDATSTPNPTPTPVQATVSDFDPDQDGGTPSERPEQVPLATDGDKTTAWTTEKYFDGPPLAPYKDGVGLMFDLGRDTEVSDLVADLGGSGYSVQLLAAPPGTTTEPTSTEGLKTVASRQGVGGRVVLTPGQPVKTRYVVLWLTALPQVAGGYQGSVLEAAVRS